MYFLNVVKKIRHISQSYSQEFRWKIFSRCFFFWKMFVQNFCWKTFLSNTRTNESKKKIRKCQKKKFLKTIFSKKSWLFFNFFCYFYFSLLVLIISGSMVQLTGLIILNFRNISSLEKVFLTLKAFSLSTFYISSLFFVFEREKNVFGNCKAKQTKKYPFSWHQFNPTTWTLKTFCNQASKK